MDDLPSFQIAFMPTYLPADLQIGPRVTFDSTVGAILESSRNENGTQFLIESHYGLLQ